MKVHAEEHWETQTRKAEDVKYNMSKLPGMKSSQIWNEESVLQEMWRKTKIKNRRKVSVGLSLTRNSLAVVYTECDCFD